MEHAQKNLDPQFAHAERGRSGFLRSGERMSSWAIFDMYIFIYFYMDLGIQMEVEIQSDSLTSNCLTDRWCAGPRTKHLDTRYFWVQERVQDGDLGIKKVLTAKIVHTLE